MELVKIAGDRITEEDRMADERRDAKPLSAAGEGAAADGRAHHKGGAGLSPCLREVREAGDRDQRTDA